MREFQGWIRGGEQDYVMTLAQVQHLLLGESEEEEFFFRQTRGNKRRAQIRSDLISSHRELLPPLDIRRISRTSHITKVYLTSFMRMKMVINMLIRLCTLNFECHG